MGLLDLILGQNNGISRYVDANKNAVHGAFAGFGQGTNIGDGFGYAARGAAAGAPADDVAAASLAADAARQKTINDTVKYLQAKHPDIAAQLSAGLPLDQAWSQALKVETPGYGDPNWGKTGPAESTDIQNFEYGLTHPGFNDYQTQKGGAAETALQPTWGIDNDPKSPTYGQKVLGQLNKAGKFVRTELPAGVSALDPVDLQGQKSGAIVDAKTAAAARAALPGAEQGYALTQKALANFDPNTTDASAKSVQAGEQENFGKLLGIYPQQMAPSIPGTNRANFKNIVDQLSGQAFLNIRQALKGAGQVTDYEGGKGEIALSRMKAAADSGDDAAFKQALLDYQQAIDNGMRLLREQANSKFAADQPNITGNGAPGPSGNVLTYNPATGELE